MLKWKRAWSCKRHGHSTVFRERWNKTKYYYCQKCKKHFPSLADADYNVRCLVSGKFRKLPLIDENALTVLVGIGDKIIKRHKLKHCVSIS